MNRACVLWAGLAVGLAGCVGSEKDKVQGRSQIGEDPAADPAAFSTVGMVTTPDNMGPVPVSGVGLVYRLQPGAGSSPSPSVWRQMLENDLKKQGFTSIKELLDDPTRTASLVIVSALIPPGARKGEPVDVQISLPDDSRTTSLKGGILRACDLVDYDTTGNLDGVVKQGRPGNPGGKLLLGSVWAKAEGPVVAGAFVPAGKADAASGQDQADTGSPSLKVGRVWGGGRVTQSRPYYFLMKEGDQNIRMAATVAARLNTTFHTTADPNLKVAEAKTRELVLVNVPHAYRHNHYRFLLVARQVPVVEVSADSIYRRKLEEELHDPATTLTAAVRLEALGGDSRRALRVGLESTSPWVRFASAEALAYLGHTDGAEVLARLAEDHPALRAHCLKALAAADDAAFTDRLVELMAHPDPVLRYGAFVALRLADENHPAARGTLLNGSFWLHTAAQGSPGMVHLTGDRRSEVVLFGDGLKIRGPFTLPVGTEFTVSMPAGAAEAKVSRVVRVGGGNDVKEVRCPGDLYAVLGTLARLGGGHAEAIEFLRRADRAQVLTAPLVVDAIPRQMSVQQLAAFAQADPTLVRADVEVARVGKDAPDLTAAGLELPSDRQADAKPADATPQRAPLSRDPGRIFGPKRPPEAPVADPLPPVNPAAGAEPAAPREPDLGRNPGTLFPRK